MKIRPENYITDVPPVQDEVQTDQYHEEISMHAFASQPAILTQDDLQGSSQTTMYTESTQGSSQPTMLLSQMSSTMLMRMMEEVKMVTSICCMSFSCPSVTNILFFLQGAQSAYSNQPVGPLPDSHFISSNELLPRPQALTTATKEGKVAATKRKATKDGKATTTAKKTKKRV